MRTSGTHLRSATSWSLVLRNCLVFGLVLIPARHAEQELTDEAFEHDGRLCEVDLIPVLVISFRAAGTDRDILPAQQTRSIDAGIAVIRDAVVARVDAQRHRSLEFGGVELDAIDTA